MDQSSPSIPPEDMYARLDSQAAPIIVDVRRDADFSGAEKLDAPAVTATAALDKTATGKR